MSETDPTPHRLGFVDVGARGGLQRKFQAHRDRLRLVLVEAEPTEAARLAAASEGGALYRVIDVPLAHVDGELTLYETRNKYCSSLLPANEAYLSQYEIARLFKLKQQTPLICARYDTLYHRDGLPEPNIVKLDVQGFEHQVLEGFGRLLQHCYAIELETHFYPLYHGQKLLHDIVAYLASYDMVLRKLSSPRSPKLDGDRHFDGDLVEVDATFTKSRKWADAQSDPVRADLDLACEIIGVPADRRVKIQSFNVKPEKK